MPAAPAEMLAIVNPSSGNGATGRRWSSIERRLREAFGSIDVEHTRAPRDAERIARQAAQSGVARLIVAGGDGTASEVASGVLAAGIQGTQVGVLPLGTGGDFARTIRTPRDLETAIGRLRKGETRRLDAGRIRFRGIDGSDHTTHFINVASLGISGLTVELVRSAPRFLGGTASYLIGALRSIRRHECRPVRLRVDGKLVHDGPLVLAAVANGSYFGGGMRISPNSQPDDGVFDVVVISEMSKVELLRNLPSLYRGTHLSHPAVSVVRGREVEAEAEHGGVLLDVDGEPLGSLPLQIECRPGVITLFGVDA